MASSIHLSLTSPAYFFLSAESGATSTRRESEYADGSTTSKAAEVEAHGAHIKGSIPIGLWQHLHTSMDEVHKLARKNDFLNSLIKGTMGCSKAYVVYLCNLFWLHKALEEAQERILKEGECPFVFRFLYRSEKLLADIKLWSIFNPTAKLFADLDSASEVFLNNIKHFVQPAVFAFVEALASVEHPLIAMGAMYALYGTIMSGGQLVKEGVKTAFCARFDETLEEGAMEETALCKEVIADPAKKEEFAERSVSFFSFPPDVDVRAFKLHWHAALDALPLTLPVDQITKQCLASIVVILEAIDSLHIALTKGL